ncbi:MAG: AMIN domain-containing protein, partial [Xanthomonadales bacterium]|nr:AMIN domain-containing protein [Xanthomonadales bacterium]
MALSRFLIALLLLVATPAWAVEVSNLRVWADPEKTRAVLDLSESTQYRLFTLANPNRVVIDLPAAALNDTFAPELKYSGVIAAVRHGRPQSNTLRIVLDLDEATKTKSFLLAPTGEYGHRLVVDLYPRDRQTSTVKRFADVQKPNRDVIIAIDAG